MLMFLMFSFFAPLPKLACLDGISGTYANRLSAAGHPRWFYNFLSSIAHSEHFSLSHSVYAPLCNFVTHEIPWQNLLYCQQVIRNKETNSTTDAKEGSLPPLQEYIESAVSRRKTLSEIEEQRNQNQSHHRDGRPLAMSWWEILVSTIKFCIKQNWIRLIFCLELLNVRKTANLF